MLEGLLTVALLAAGAPAPAEPLVREVVVATALAQLHRPDPRWTEAQRDCAGLVRWSYHEAFRQLWPERLSAGAWRDGQGHPSAFADAATLLRRSFGLLGRGPEARGALRSGDLVAFSREEEDGRPVTHLMLVAVPQDRAHAPALVVYHTGDPHAPLRAGPLEALAREAPAAWRPVSENPHFLGFFRLKEWLP